jgi:cell division protein FtsZ
MADQVLHQGVRGITDLMVMPGLINLDFADVRSVMSEMGKAMMGTGEAEGENRAIEAAEKAIANPLLDGVSMRGAKGVIVSITGGDDMRLMEVDEAANHIKDLVDPDANIIWGSAFNNDLQGTIRVSVVATGIDADHSSDSASTEAAPKPFAFSTSRPRASAPVAAPPPPAATAPEPAAPEAAAPAAETSAAPAVEAVAPSPPPRVNAAARGSAAGATARRVQFEDEELQLKEDNILAPPVQSNPVAPPAGEEADQWSGDQTPRAARTGREGGTLFERMSSIARGAKGHAEPPPPPAAGRERSDPLDIPRFLNKQNNQ